MKFIQFTTIEIQVTDNLSKISAAGTDAGVSADLLWEETGVT